MYLIKIEEIPRTWFDKLLGRVRYLWASALCSPNDEWSDDVGRDLVHARLRRVGRNKRDGIPGRAGVVAVKHEPLCSIDARLKAERQIWAYRASREKGAATTTRLTELTDEAFEEILVRATAPIHKANL